MTRASIVFPSRGGAAHPHVVLESPRAQPEQDAEMTVALDGDIGDGKAAKRRLPDQLPRDVSHETDAPCLPSSARAPRQRSGR